MCFYALQSIILGTASKNHTIGDFSVQEGDRVFVDVAQANTDVSFGGNFDFDLA
jgi:hypothetical protein